MEGAKVKSFDGKVSVKVDTFATLVRVVWTISFIVEAFISNRHKMV